MEKLISVERWQEVEPRWSTKPAVLGGLQPNVMAVAACHSLTWLLVSNGVGLLLGALLLFPRLNSWLGEWTYGRWVPLHLNHNLYGWCSLPLVGWLFHAYQVDRLPAWRWGRSVLWGWSTALVVGSISWLNGQSSGKLFLDWQGYPRLLLVMAMLLLWVVLAVAFWRHGDAGPRWSRARRSASAAGLLALLFVPFSLYWATQPNVYPPVNPDTGGPTGASLLESTLGIILILLVLPLGLGREVRERQRVIAYAWVLFAAGAIVSFALGRGNSSHHKPSEILGLASLLAWVPILPAYFNAFDWPLVTKCWRNACLLWWGLLVVSAWMMFLPGFLEHCKFTDALVGHSHMAMAGFVSSMNILVLMTLLGEDARTFSSRWAFFAWQFGTLGYVGIMVWAGWLEGSHSDFTIIPGGARDSLYCLRMVCGGIMTAAATHWWLQLRKVRRGTS